MSGGKPRARPNKRDTSTTTNITPNTSTPLLLPFQQQEQQNQHIFHDIEVGVQQNNLDCPRMEEEDELLVHKKKEIKRSWREEWKLQHKWVYPITKETGDLRLKCQWCTAYNMDNVFAKEGCSTIQLSALNTHAKSEAHKTAESRWESSDAAMTALTVPDNLWTFGGGKAGGGEDEGLEGVEIHGPAAPDLNRKRKFVPNASPSPMARNESLGNILQKNNNKIVEILLEAEAGRNKRHTLDVSLLKKHYALEEQRQRLDSERLQFERARLEAMVTLGQQYNSALANIGDGLLKIGAALENKKN